MMDAWARLMYRRRAVVLFASALVLPAALLVLVQGGTLTTGTIAGIEAERAQRLAESALGRPGDASFVLVFRSAHLRYTDAAFREAMTRGLAPLVADPGLLVTSPLTLPPALEARFVSPDGDAAFAVVAVQADVKEAARRYPELRARVDAAPLEVLATGHLAFTSDLDRTLEHDLVRAELVSLPLALFVLLLVFGSVVAAALPIGVGALAVLCGIAAVLGLSRVTDMAQYTINVVSLIGLGVAIDYSLFIVSRYRDELATGCGVEDAIARALDTTGRAVLFSGIAVGAGLSGLLFFHGSYLASMGLAGTVVVALAVAFTLTFLPAVLAYVGPRIDALRVGRPRRRDDGGRWHAVALSVMRHPIRVLVPTLALLLLLGAPFLRIELAATDVTVLPAETEARRGYELLRSEFPNQAANRIVALVTFPSGNAFTPERVGALYDASRRFRALPGVISVESVVDLDPRLDRAAWIGLASMPPAMRPPELSAALAAFVGGPVTMLEVLTEAPTTSHAARTIVQEIRQNMMVGDGTLLVGGATAHDLDATEFVRTRTPAAIAFVMAATVLVLFFFLRSVVLPLKAVVMNVLSIAGSFGAMVWIFQDGHLSGLLGFEPRPLEPVLPPLLFCFVFGLSMDYEVLLLARIREEYRRTGDNTMSVAWGLEKSGRLILSAAAIMVAVFLAFALASVVVVKAMGVGLALAVALDATVVRVLVVPAAMRLFGNLNWWAPPFLRPGHRAHRAAPPRP